MKTLLTFIIIILALNVVYSQSNNTLNVYRNNGTVVIYPLNVIDSINFTICPSTIVYEGKTYNTVLIGKQCWLQENLDVGTRIDGNQNQTNDGFIEKYCYSNNPANCNIYGGLYQWDELMQYVTSGGTQGICPTGWHIPTQAEFQELIATAGLNGNSYKAIGQGTGTNTSGFSAMLAGLRDNNGNFVDLGTWAVFWSSTQGSTNAISLNINAGETTPFFLSDTKNFGFSVRCLKD